MTSSATVRICVAILAALIFSGLVSPALSPSIPVPLIDQPLVPAAAVPGGSGFALIVNGTGFVSASVVNWNGSARSTTFVSASQLAAIISASDVQSAGTASVTVVNPAPGGASNPAFFQITTAVSPVTVSRADISVGKLPRAIATGDFNRDGKLDMAVVNRGSNTVSILLGNGDGTFQPALSDNTGSSPVAIVAADFNNDGNLDLAVLNNGAATISILLGNGNGTFQAQQTFATGAGPSSLAAADLNGDGKLDLVVANFSANNVSILLGNGDGTFQSHVDYAAGAGAGYVAVGDFNRDAKLDLAVANFSANTVSILLGNGDGTFQPQTTAATGNGPTSVVIADFNADGKLDLAVSNFSDNTVSILAGNGDGTFQPRSNFSTATGPQQVIVGDMTGDGVLDLVTVHQTSALVSILAGNGNGTFQPHVDYAVATTPKAVAAADFNNDGRLDLVTASSVTAGTVSVLLQAPIAGLSPNTLTFASQAVGTTSGSQTVTLSNTGSAPLALGAVTFTGANPGDFAQTNSCPAQLPAATNCAFSVTFTPTAVGARTASLSVSDNAAGSPQTVALSGAGTAAGPISSLSPTSLTFGNQSVGTTSAAQPVTLTNTGTASLLISSIAPSGDFAQTNTCASTVLPGANCAINITFTPTALGTRTGTVTITDNASDSPQTVPLIGTGIPNGAIPVPFINQPLVPSAVVPGGPGFTLTVNGTGFIAGATVNWNGSARATTFVSGSQLTAAISAADISAPVTASVTVVNPAPGGGRSNAVFLAVTNPTSSVGPFLTSSPATGSCPDSIAVGDFNGDGKLDLAVANFIVDTISVLLGDGAGNFTLASSPATGSFPISVTVGDFNGDGKLDLAVALENDTVSVLLGDGTGNFTLASSSATGSNPFSLAVGDFNADGKLDLAVANEASNTVSILLGDGTGNFTLASSPATGVRPFSVAVGDFNGDGKLDLAVANNGSNTVSILLGDGTGHFTLASSPATGVEPNSLAAGDFNADGKLDLAVTDVCGNDPTCKTPGTVSILLGDGTGSFSLASTPATGDTPRSVAVGDFNGDGKLDLAVANQCGSDLHCQSLGTVFILLGDGTGNFTLASSPAVGSQPVSLAAADFNGDGRLDLAAVDAGGNANTVSILVQAPAVALSNTSLAFGNENIGSTSNPMSSTLTNTGSAPLDIAAISLTGPNIGDFTTTNTCGSIVFGGESCTITVTFTPTAPGARTASISITDNVSGSPQIIGLSGTGTGPVVSLSPASLAFGPQFLGTSSAVQTVMLTNTGNVTLTISSVTTTGDFSQTNTCGTSVAAGGSCIISVTFKPTAIGTRTGSVIITDNAFGGPQTITLTGTGTVVKLSPVSLAFPTQVLATTGPTKKVTLTNVGSTALTVTSIAVTGADAGDFSQTNTCGGSVGAGASCTISVTFKPTAIGTRTASVSVSDNGGGSPQTVALLGTGTEVSLSVASLNFGNVKVGKISGPKNVILTNVGATTLGITSIVIAGTDKGDFSVGNTCGGSVPPGGTCSIVLHFLPTKTGLRTASVNITDNGGGSPQKIALSGTGT